MRDKVFYTICFGFLLGVLWRSFPAFGGTSPQAVVFYFYLTLWLIGISFLLIFFHFFIIKNKWGIIAGIFVLAFSLGIFRFNMVDIPNPLFFESQTGQKATLSGIIVDEPNIKETNQQLTVLLKSIQSDTNSAMAENVSSKILLSVGLDTNYKYGEKEIRYWRKNKKIAR